MDNNNNTEKEVENKMKELEKSLEDEARQMVTNTSCLAIGNIFIRNHPLLKVLWCIAFILCTILTIRQLYGLSRNYFAYPFNTIIKLQSYHDEFPSVTFCNLNPLRKSQVYLGKPALQNFLSELETKNFTLDNVNEMDTRLEDELSFMKLIVNESREIRTQMGHQIKDFILQCYFLGKKCNYNELFSLLLSNKFGNCFSFNPSKLLKKMTNIQKRSRNKGLFLTLYVQNTEYLTNFIPSSGIRIHLHPINSMEIPDTYGMTLPTGFQVSLGVVPTKIKRLQEVTGNCEKGTEFMNKYNSIYTKEACYNVCLQEMIFRLCGCYDTTFQLYKSDISNLICNTDKKEECMINKIYDFDTLKGKCTCKDACNATIYDINQSFSTWPAASYEKRFFNDLSDVYPNFSNLTKSDKFKARSNFTNVVIYIEDRSHKEISQVRAYQWDLFLSDIGGTLSLYLGFSVLTAFEFFESITLLITYLCGRVIYRNQ